VVEFSNKYGWRYLQRGEEKIVEENQGGRNMIARNFFSAMEIKVIFCSRRRVKIKSVFHSVGVVVSKVVIIEK